MDFDFFHLFKEIPFTCKEISMFSKTFYLQTWSIFICVDLSWFWLGSQYVMQYKISITWRLLFKKKKEY